MSDVKHILGALLVSAGILLAAAECATAGELGVKVTQHSRIADDDMYQVGGWEGLEINYRPTDSSGFIFASIEEARIYPKGNSHNITLAGVGVGIKHNLGKHFSVFGQFGYYFVKNNWGNRREFNESAHYYLNDRWKDSIRHGDYYNFDSIEIDHENTFAGTIGFELNYPITQRLSANMGVSYRNMKVRELIRGKRDEWTKYHHPDASWEFDISRNMSTLNYSLGLTYRF